MSFWLMATVAATSAVMPPTQAMTGLAQTACSRSGRSRMSRYTPDVTMVAAWMRADTGVGPAMASGNHTNRGSWADLPVAAIRKSTAMAGTVVECKVDALPAMSV